MDYSISITEKSINLNLSGSPSSQKLLVALDEVSSELKKMTIPVLFINGEQLDKPFILQDRFYIFTCLKELNIDKSTKIIIQSKDDIANRDLLEMMAKNRGWLLKHFNSRNLVDRFIDKIHNPSIYIK
ncbi:hypothetical protein [Flammeovirga kamogawensis]|uniref:Uncharacterized protein n=1 Tax=Flammeovirga kamogawensis TaxID=373891 RepID=A0ABX8GW56_9BACT|nr:hypothetical protein [Flammeovirga kamogawensis]MBB6460975.1 hypothetical protein [Flammeovirga kamogawensis]QWG07547.1 hypothetical protein KM029_01015 [Flammeovirga kamogawensis]TRX69359.1 hypothetical protein EO216_14955 [Flammeovirga kamogawensis]